MSLLTRKTSNDVGTLLELPGNMFIDYYKRVEEELIEEQKAKKKKQKEAESKRQAERRAQSRGNRRTRTNTPKIPRRR